MQPRRSDSGFTLLEVMIAMSILVVGATSILGIFVAAVSFHTQRVEENRKTDIYNWAKDHAQLHFESFDPSTVKQGEKPFPKAILADFTDIATALKSLDPMIREGAKKFPGFKYEVRFEENPFAVQGSSVVADIRVFRLSGQLDTELVSKEFLTRRGTPVHEFFKSPTLEKRDADRGRPAGGSGRRG